MRQFKYEENSGFIAPEIHILMVKRKSDSWIFPSLSAPYWRLYWISEGNQWVEYEGKRIQLKPKRRYLIPPDTEFSAHSQGYINQIFIHFLINRNDRIDGRPHPGIYELTDRPFLKEIFHEIVSKGKENQALNYGKSQIAASLCSLALADLPVNIFTEPVWEERLYRAVYYIRRTLNISIRAADIARESGLGIKSLERLFQKNFGETPLQFKRRLRIDQACMKLHFSNETLDSIAESLGFSDRFHLTKVFTSIRGMSPGKYRKMVDELYIEES